MISPGVGFLPAITESASVRIPGLGGGGESECRVKATAPLASPDRSRFSRGGGGVEWLQGDEKREKALCQRWNCAHGTWDPTITNWQQNWSFQSFMIGS